MAPGEPGEAACYPVDPSLLLSRVRGGLRRPEPRRPGPSAEGIGAASTSPSAAQTAALTVGSLAPLPSLSPPVALGSFPRSREGGQMGLGLRVVDPDEFGHLRIADRS